MIYTYQCKECGKESNIQCRMSERPDKIICLDCAGDATRVMSKLVHTGDKVKGYAGGSRDGLKGH